MSDLELTRELCDFIAEAPTSFHAAAKMMAAFDAAGLVRLDERDAWQIEPGTCAYVVRNDSSFVAFKVGEALPKEGYHFQMVSAHCDSPMFKIKHIAELEGPREYLRLNVEGYGGILDASWLDRPLGVAGRVVVRTDDGRIESRLVASEREVAIIPNVAIHQRRNANEGFALNRQVDLCPLFSAGELKRGAFDEMVAELAGVATEQLLGKDLFVVNRTEPRVWGWADEFVSAPRLDDLQCAFPGHKAFLAANNPACVTVFACFDNEEVGSGTRHGALSTFLNDVLARINSALGFSEDDYRCALAGSFMVSCDNGHAAHPNHPEFYDSENVGRLNGGVLVKETARQKYATDALTRAVFTAICNDAGVPTQTFANRSDSLGGATLGNLSSQQVSVATVDVGLAQLAMHSCYETAGTADAGHLMRALAAFYATDVQMADGAVALG